MVSAPPSRNSSSSTEAQLYLLARDLQYTDSLAEVVSIVPHRLSEVFSRVHVATFHLVDSLSARRNSSSTVGSSSKGSHVLITPDSLVPMDGGHGIDARVERMRQCAIDGSRVTGKTGARPWMYEPVVIAATTGFMPSDPSSSVRIDTRGGNSVAGVIEFGFLRSQEQRQLPWLSAAESLVLGEATSLISKALTRLVRKRELQDQAAGAMESVDAMQAECDSLVQAYQYTEKRQVMAQRQLRIATELLAARDLKGLSSAISSKRMADLLGADRATLFFRSLRRIGGSNSSISSSSNSSNNSASASAFSEPSMVNEFVSTTTPARYGADGVSGVAKAARRGDVVTSIGEGGQYCSYLPVRLHSIKVTSPPRKTKSGAKTAKTMVKKSLEVPVVLDICWKKVEETEVLGAEKSDKEDQEEGTSGDVFSEPILESDRASLLAYLSMALQMVVTSFMPKNQGGVSTGFQSILNVSPMEAGDIHAGMSHQSASFESPAAAGVVAARVLKAVSEVPRIAESNMYNDGGRVGASGTALGIERSLMRLVAGPLKVALCAASARLYVLDQNFHDIVDEWEETVLPRGGGGDGGGDGGNGDSGGDSIIDDDCDSPSNWEDEGSSDEEKLSHMTDVAAAARLKQLRELKKESRRMKREARQARARVARLQQSVPIQQKRSRTRRVGAPPTHFYYIVETDDGGDGSSSKCRKFPLREGGIGYGDGEGGNFMSSALESGIAGSVFANGMTVTTNASEMRRAIAQRREEHRESQDSKTAGDGMIRERDFEMPLFLYDKTSSRFNPNVVEYYS